MKKTVRTGFLLLLFALSAITALWAGGGSARGREVIIGNWWGDWNVRTFKPQSEHDELLLEHRRRIPQDHGINVTEKMITSSGEVMETIITSIMSGKPAAQSFILLPYWAITLQRQGLLASLSESRAVDLKNSTAIPYRQVAYNQDIGALFTFNGRQFGLAIGYGGSRHSAGVYYNKRLFIEAGLDPDLPFTMQREGTWTWDVFLDISRRLTRDRNNTGRINTWALAADYKNTILETLVFSNGAEFVGKDERGRFINASGRPEFLEALNFARRLNSEGFMLASPDGANWDWYISMFVDAHVAMLLGDEWIVDPVSKMNDDWGYVLPPRGPRSSDYRFPTDENVMVIPSTYQGEEIDTILTAINLWFMPVDDDWKSGLWSFYRDRRSVDETMTMIRSPRYGRFRNHMLIPGMEIGDIAWSMWGWDDDPARLIESVSHNWNTLINDANGIN